MTKSEIEVLRHITNCVIFCHQYDDSYKITKESIDKEMDLFKKSIRWLASFDKDHKVIAKDYERIMSMKEGFADN